MLRGGSYPRKKRATGSTTLTNVCSKKRDAAGDVVVVVGGGVGEGEATFGAREGDFACASRACLVHRRIHRSCPTTTETGKKAHERRNDTRRWCKETQWHSSR
jgi:hypothetical protein